MAVREKESTPLYVPASFTNGNGTGKGKGSKKESPRRERTWRFWVGMTFGAVLVVGWVAVAAFFVGQETRPAEAQVKERIADRVADERFAADKERARALKRQKRELDRRWESQMKRNTKRARTGTGGETATGTAARPATPPAWRTGGPRASAAAARRAASRLGRSRTRSAASTCPASRSSVEIAV